MGAASTSALLDSYAAFAHGLPPGHVFQNRIQGLTGYNELSAAQSSIDEAVQSFLNPDVQSAAQQTARRARAQAAQEVHAAAFEGVAHRPQRQRRGRVGRERELPARSEGLQDPAPAEQPAGQRAELELLPLEGVLRSEPGGVQGSRAGRGQARRQHRRRGAAPRSSRSPRTAPACVLVVGSTFHNRLAPSFVQQAPPTHHPPVIRRDPGATRSSLAGVKRRVRFRLQLPTVLERSSNLDSGYGETPLRVYSLGGRPSVRLTYRTGANEYWGDPGDRLERRSDLRRPQPEPDRRRAALRPLLQRLPPAHGGAAERRRELLGREHAAGLALERDDALDRARAQADDVARLPPVNRP